MGGCFGFDWSNPVPLSNFFHVPLYSDIRQATHDRLKSHDIFILDNFDPLRRAIDRLANGIHLEDVTNIRTNGHEWGYIVRHKV
jgi:hypothetical protein